MNCTVCDKPHSKEQPLTVAHNDEWLCPGCLKELDIADIPLYGRSPIEVAEAHVNCRCTIKVGDVELPVKSLEMETKWITN